MSTPAPSLTVPAVALASIQPPPGTQQRIDALIAAFATDNFTVNPQTDVVLSGDRIGMVATHNTATIGTTGVYKKAYYVEGTPFDLGYLIGRIAEPTVSQMTTTFLDNVVLSFAGVQLDPWLQHIIGAIIADVAYLGAQRCIPDVPEAYQQELEGIYEGCLAANPHTKVTRDRLWTLNVGIDAALAFIYTLELPVFKPYAVPLKPEHFRIPFMCTGYTSQGQKPDGTPFHYFGRDFMFTTADVFQNTAAPIIYRPLDGYPMVSLAAPGWMGSITAMNNDGVACSVNMAPSALCNSKRPGFNGLLLARHAIQNGGTAQAALNLMVQAQRGVSWIHVLSDGGTDTSCIVEAGMSQETIPFMSYPPASLTGQGGPLAPAAEWVQNPSTEVQNGLMARWTTYQYPETTWPTVNPGMFAAFKANPGAFDYDAAPTYTYTYNEADMGPDAFLDATWTDRNCPMGLWISPERRSGQEGMLVATNRFIIPEMQLTTMAAPADRMAQRDWDDVQWRYDELSRFVWDRLQANKEVTGSAFLTYDEAKAAADYLAPQGEFPTYSNPKNLPLDQVQIGGAVSIMDLKARTMESHYGYYSDEWVMTTLNNYVV
ncbi:MAG TPA: hypothetical protein VFQ45_09685 [Longimicrobium sp.]|nr:hypothetical protein [Longimicrobium sp.]